MGKMERPDAELEMQFIREFASDNLFGIPADERRERIRVAIHVRKLVHLPYRDGPMTYGEAYKKCYRMSVEMRRMQRDKIVNRPVPDCEKEDEE